MTLRVATGKACAPFRRWSFFAGGQRCFTIAAMGRRIAVVLALGALAWLFLVRPATRGVALADLYNRVNEDRCCTDGLIRSPNACARALDELARRAPPEQLARCGALEERQSRDPARRLCGFLASPEDRKAAATELALANRLAEAAAQPGCHRMGAYAALRAAGKNEMSALVDAYRTDGTCRGPG